MSNNPFLKSNNRFQFLDDPIDNNHTIKDKNPAIPYVSSEKSFAKSSNGRDERRDERRDDRRDDRRDERRDDRRDDRKPNNNFRNRREPEKIKIKQVEINVETEYFPDLVPNKKDTDKKESTKFKDILTTQIEEIVNDGNNIRPGWVEISRTKTTNKTIYNIGPYNFQRQNPEKTPNYIMSKAIESMKYNWDKRKAEYDSINGEGAYDEKYILPPVYGPEYDSYDDDSYDDESDSYYENDN